jgi:hypothetical protein
MNVRVANLKKPAEAPSRYASIRMRAADVTLARLSQRATLGCSGGCDGPSAHARRPDAGGFRLRDVRNVGYKHRGQPRHAGLKRANLPRQLDEALGVDEIEALQ